MATIKLVKARSIFDSRGNPTVEAVENVNKIIGPALIGKDPVDQTGIDNSMVQEPDGTQNQWGRCKQKVSTSVMFCHCECPENVGASPRNAVVAQAGEEAEIEEEILPERRESLVVNSVLGKRKREITEPSQRKNLFRNICTVQGKYFLLVIDSGSTVNLVSTEVIEQLKLKTKKHPTPYTVSWVQQGHQLTVEEQCEIELQMCNYKDKVLCDVIPMDVCHILLGRPWQYDRAVMHDGRTNAYMVVKDGVRHILKPMCRVVGANSLSLSGKEYLLQIEEEEAVIKKKYGQDATNVGDEGGFAPNIQENKEGLESLKIAIEKAGYTGKVVIGMDVAASEFYTEKDQKYDLNFKEENNDVSQKISGSELIKIYESFIEDYPIVSIEDLFDQDDWAHYVQFTATGGEKVQIVGDDLLVTNPKRVEKAINETSCNALLLKVNQIGSVTESIEALKMSKRAGWGVMTSHRRY